MSDAPAPRLPIAELFQAVADSSRLRILALLKSMELSVGELAQVLGQSQPRVSRHVRILADSGLAERHKEGSWVFLRLSPTGAGAAVLALIEERADCASRDIFEADRIRLANVRAVRAAAAERYFASLADRWDSIRSLHVPEASVEQAIERALGGAPLGRLVDIGTGTGRMIELLGPRAEEAIGFDRSYEMLRVARVKLDRAAIAGASLRQGDMYALPLADGVADTVILHQVLHYAQAPAAAIAEAARILAPGGRLLIVDFAPHDREELRTRDAHTRLGFADEAIHGWFAEAGLAADLTEHLEGGELTVTLWRSCKAPALKQMAA
ncbi:MAG TPA: metalloregulator ArsR/SmtB family transcription factor [Sphingomicrobium sp.]|nr:metalloregulator ArsR/SmtB family transcription factor [Sphingomicrobium sp.]